jgi:hypothetical protein
MTTEVKNKALAVQAAVIIGCLKEYDRHRQERTAPMQPRSFPATDWRDRPEAETVAAALEGVLRDPVHTALRLKARDIGWRVFCDGGLTELRQVARLVVEALPDNPHLAERALNSWWSGIGDTKRGRWPVSTSSATADRRSLAE